MPRGGRRSTTWKPTWKHGKTRTIRVPIVLADSILDLARILDEGKEVSVDSLVTGNNSEPIQKLDSEDRIAAIDALTTALSMKQIAMSKESKKRSKSNTVTIEKWLKEIESLEKAIAYLKLI